MNPDFLTCNFLLLLICCPAELTVQKNWLFKLEESGVYGGKYFNSVFIKPGGEGMLLSGLF